MNKVYMLLIVGWLFSENYYSNKLNQFTFINPIKFLDPSWFGLPILINKK